MTTGASHGHNVRAALILLGALHVGLFWISAYFPSQDGPAHVGSASILLSLADHDPFFSQYLEPAWRLTSNQVWHGLLVAFGRFMPVLYAEKLALSFYLAAYLLAMAILIRRCGGNARAVALAFPAAYSAIFYFGFFSACLGITVALFSLAALVHFLERPSALRWIVLAALVTATYVIHVLVVAVLLAAMPVLAVSRWAFHALSDRESRSLPTDAPGRRALPALLGTLLAMAPAATLLVLFLGNTDSSSVDGGNSLLNNTATVSLFQGFNITSKVYHALVQLSYLDLVVTLPWHLLLAWLTFRTWQEFRAGRLPPSRHRYFVIAPIAMAAVMLVSPISIAPFHNMDSRLLPFFHLVWIVWISMQRLPGHTWNRAFILAATIALVNVAYRLPMHIALSQDVARFVDIGKHIDDNSAVITVSLGPRAPGIVGVLGNQLRPDYAVHAASYLGIDRHILNVRNYELGVPYFPIRYRDPANTQLLAGFWHQSDFAVDVRKEAFTTLPQTHYVLLWGEADRRSVSQARIASLTDTLQSNGFEEIADSEPGAETAWKLYRRRVSG